MHDGAEYLGFRTVDGAVFVDQRDEIADPFAEIRAFVQVDPSLVCRDLLHDPGVDRALGPCEIQPFHAADRGDQFRPALIGQRIEVRTVISVRLGLFGVVILLLADVVGLEEMLEIRGLVVREPLRLGGEHVLGFLTRSQLDEPGHHAVVVELEILNQI